MASSKTKSRRPLLQLLTFMFAFRHVHGLSQEYCSSQNTGSDYSAVHNIYQSNGACSTECSGNYAFAIVQYQNCWCSNYAPADQSDVSQCNTNCPGYPNESCGNQDQGLYGYIALNKSPSGTAGGSSSAASSTQSSSSQTPTSTSTTQQQSTSSPLPSSSAPASSPPPSSSAPASSSNRPSTNVVYSSVPVTVTIQQSPSVVVSYVTPTSSIQQSTTSPSSTSSSTIPSTTTFSTSSSSPTSSPPVTTSEQAAAASTSDPSLTQTTLVSTRVITISGAPVTQTVTTTPMVVNPNAHVKPERKGVNTGAVAGAVVGSVLGVALLLIGAFFLWRRKRSPDTGAETGSTTASSARRNMERNTSVLSKTGLLSSAGPALDVEKTSYDGPGFINTGTIKRSSTMFGGSGGGPSPVSPVAYDDSSQRSRRNSRPLVYDQRLNPNAIMENWGANGSRVSIGTMQDQRDYSRPLGVTNPDPVHD